MKHPIILEHLKLNRSTFKTSGFDSLNSFLGWILADDYKENIKFAINILGECFVTEDIPSICLFAEPFIQRLISEEFNLGIVVELYEFETYDDAYDTCSFIKQEYYNANLI